MNKLVLITIVGFLFTALGMKAQQLDQIGKNDPVKIDGGISVNQLYRHNDSYDTDQPYSLVATGNITTSLYGWSVPLSFTWSNYQWTYTQPFNQLSLHPSYKWVTAHIGYTSMSFSPWSLSGHSFAGVGVDLTPGTHMKISAMYGRLNKETLGDSVHSIDPAYQRMGSGLKVDYNFSKVSVGASVFYAADDDGYLYEADSLGILPAENLVLGMSTKVNLIQGVSLMADYYTSFFTDNSRVGNTTDWSDDNTQQYNAFKTSLNWSNRLGQIGAGIERVDPGYESLGAYYTTNDYVNYTFNFATAILQNKVTMALSTGIRQNNLDNKSDQDTDDQITSVQIGFIPSHKVNISMSYSNFYNYTYIRTAFDEVEAQTQYELMDTISYTQINENINISGNYNFGDKEKNPQSITMSLSYQSATQEQSDNPEHTNNDFLNGSGGYNYSFKPIELSLGLSCYYSLNRNADNETQAIGPMLFIRKKFFQKQLKANLNVAYNKSTIDGEDNGHTLTSRLGFNYSVKKQHNFTFNLAYSNRVSSTKNVSNYTASLSYSYRFGWPRKKEEAPSSNP